MAYADLYADASLYMSLNNAYDYVTTGTLNSSSGTGTPVFEANGPSNTGSTHSLKISNLSATIPRHVFLFPQIETEGRSVSFWYRFDKATGGTFAPLENTGANIQMYSNDPSSTTSNEDTMTINGGSWKLDYSASDRKVVIVTRDVTSASNMTTTTVTPNQKIIDGQWHHIAMVERKLPGLTAIERAIYVDGICINFTNTTSMNGFYTNFGGQGTGIYGFKIFQTLLSDASNRYLAHYAVWTKALTKEEIRAQAWYGLTGGDYTSLILSDNPYYFTTLDNENKATDATVYGDTSWGVLNDDQSCVTVNQLGYPTGKSWKTVDTGVATTNIASTTTTSIMNGINTIIRSGEFSMEFWFKTTGKQLRYILEYSPGTNGAGYNLCRMLADGRPVWSMAYKSGASSYVTGTLGSISPLGLAGTKIYHGDTSASLNGYADGEWHHVVFIQSNTEQLGATAGLYYQKLYIDGFEVDRTQRANTYGWLDLLPTGVSNFYRMGNQSTPLNDFFYDSIAFYSRRLTQEEVAEHFIAGKTYVVPSGRTVKYWDGTQWSTSSDQKVYDGTNWVNWDAKRYDGNSWISI